VTRLLRRCWSLLREVSGDDAYERYLAHRRGCASAATASAPLDRAAFFKEEQRRKWDGVRRCC
jgi:uncharacterized short protein YbdD (DUF466 family)